VRFYGWHFNCCFELPIEEQQQATLDCGDDLPQPYHDIKCGPQFCDRDGWGA
jgi:hypothetical protein